MSGTELTPDELNAGAIVAQQLGGKLIERDGEVGSHDFDVELGDGQIVALEITSARDAQVASLRSAAIDRPHSAPRLEASWWLGLEEDPPIDVKRIASGVVDHLAVLEQHQLASVGGVGLAQRRPPPDAGADTAAACRALFALGVSYARRLPPEPGQVNELIFALHRAVGAGFGSLYALIEGCARKKAPKLIATSASARHLFVWVNGSAADAELAISTLAPPAATPSVPAGIDVVWVATPGTGGQLWARLWSLWPPGGWEVL